MCLDIFNMFYDNSFLFKCHLRKLKNFCCVILFLLFPARFSGCIFFVWLQFLSVCLVPYKGIISLLWAVFPCELTVYWIDIDIQFKRVCVAGLAKNPCVFFLTQPTKVFVGLIKNSKFFFGLGFSSRIYLEFDF